MMTRVNRTWVGLAVLAACWAAGVNAWAQTADSPKFRISGFKVLGANPLSDNETTETLAVFLRQDADIELLQRATAALEAKLRDRGFGLHRVALPPQEVGDTVTLEVVKFSIGEVRVERVGADGKPMPAGAPAVFADANIRRNLPGLQSGGTPNLRDLAVQTAIANDSAVKQLQLNLREGSRPDQIDATVQVRENKPWWGALSANNAGSASSGQDRLTLSLAHANLFDRDHQVVGSFTTSAEKGGDVKQLGLLYRLPLPGWGTVLSASATQSDVVGSFGTFSSTGAGHTWGLQATHHLRPSGGYRGFVNAGIDNKVYDVTVINGIPSPGQKMRRSQPLTVGYSARDDADARSIAYSVELVQNFAVSSGNDLAAYQSEDPRVSTVKWRALRGSMSYSMPLFERTWALTARSQWQWSDQALISGEQFGVGGANSVRGTSERPISADRGALLSVEMSGPALFAGIRPSVFADAAHLANRVSNNATKLANDKVASVGLGLRYSAGALGASLDYGRVVTGSAVPSSINNAAPQAGDEKAHLNLTLRF